MPPSYTVLYVDDEPALLEITRRLLEKDGEFSVDCALSGYEAITRSATRQYDVIVSNHQMLDMDGISFLKAVREQLGDIPFILFTGRGSKEVVIEAYNNGADFYIRKGEDQELQFIELAFTIKQAVRRKRVERSVQESEKRFSDIFDSLPDPTFAIDLSGRVIAWNHAMEDFSGISPSDIIGKGDYEYSVPFYGVRKPLLINFLSVPGSDLAGEYSEIRREGETLTAEAAIHVLSGEERIVWTKASPLYDPDHNRIGATESMCDVTEWRKNESWFRGLFDQTFQFTGVLDLSGRVIHANHTALDFIGKELEEVVMSHSGRHPG